MSNSRGLWIIKFKLMSHFPRPTSHAALIAAVFAIEPDMRQAHLSPIRQDTST